MSLSQCLTCCGQSLGKVMTHSFTDLINICSVSVPCWAEHRLINKTDKVPYIKELTVK